MNKQYIVSKKYGKTDNYQLWLKKYCCVINIAQQNKKSELSINKYNTNYN